MAKTLYQKYIEARTHAELAYHKANKALVQAEDAAIAAHGAFTDWVDEDDDGGPPAYQKAAIWYKEHPEYKNPWGPDDEQAGAEQREEPS